jgi:membrane associated rhomboid family serine protease
MLIPYSTDAPIYHLPIVTVGLIVVNCFVFFTLPAEMCDAFILEFGNGLHPVQWVASNFIHASFTHLLGNMIFLWAFGLVVEGKLGAWRFLLVYLGIGVGQCFIEQTMMLGSYGGSYGASAIVYGLLAMALIWAPKNEMSCLLWIYWHPILVDVSLATLGGLMIGVEFLAASLVGFSIGSQMLHLMGAAIGGGVAVYMLKRNWVDCEGWDLLTLYGKYKPEQSDGGRIRRPVRERDRNTAAPAFKVTPQHATAQIREILAEGNTKLALAAHRRMSKEHPRWHLPERLLIKLLHQLYQQGEYDAGLSVANEYLQTCRDQADLVRLIAARILLDHRHQPEIARQQLWRVHRYRLSPQLRDAHQALLDRVATA